MTKAVLRIRRNTDAALADMGKRFTAAWKSGKSPAHVFTSESPAALFRVLSPKRWELLERLQPLGPSSLRGLARSLERESWPTSLIRWIRRPSMAPATDG